MLAKTFVAFASLCAAVVAQNPVVNTPTGLTTCQPSLLTWANGVAPYFITIIPAGQVSAAPLKTFEETSATSLTWIVDLPAGTELNVQLKDSTGATVYSGVSSILAGANTNISDCSGGSSAGTSSSRVETTAEPTTTRTTNTRTTTTHESTESTRETTTIPSTTTGTTEGSTTETTSAGTTSGTTTNPPANSETTTTTSSGGSTPTTSQNAGLASLNTVSVALVGAAAAAVALF